MDKRTNLRERGIPVQPTSLAHATVTRTRHLDLRDRKRLTFLGDLVVSILAAVIAVTFWSWTDHGHITPSWVIQRFFWLPILAALWILALALAGNYVPPYAFHKKYVIRSLILAVILALFLYMAVYFGSPRTLLPRLVVLVFVGMAIVLTAIWREFWYDWLNEHAVPRPVILIGSPPDPEAMTDLLNTLAQANYHILGMVTEGTDLEPWESPPENHPLPSLGEIDELPEIVARTRPAELIVLNPSVSTEVAGILTQCHVQGVAVTTALEVFEILTGRVALEWIQHDWLRAIPLNHQGTSVLYQVTKRVMDLFGATLGMLIFAPLLPFIALAIRLDSPGPIFYRQKRVGRGGKTFIIWKLRTMQHDAEKSGAPQWAQKDDPRITRVGRWLRKFRIDEFPQFWNILKGEMSAVGPRPERPEFEAMIAEHLPMYPLRHAVKPGMAGWAMIHFDYVDSLEDARTRLEYDLFYIKHQSLWLDILIILQAALELVLRRGR